MRTFAILFLGLALSSAQSLAQKLESPVYKSWSQFPVGTEITIRSITEAKGQSIQTTTTINLIKITDDAITLESVTVSNATGFEIEEPPQTYKVGRYFRPRGGSNPGRSKNPTDEGEEEIEIAGSVYRATWYDTEGKTEAGPSYGRNWYSDEVPGRLLKSVIRVPAADKTTTVELIEIKKPRS